MQDLHNSVRPRQLSRFSQRQKKPDLGQALRPFLRNCTVLEQIPEYGWSRLVETGLYNETTVESDTVYETVLRLDLWAMNRSNPLDLETPSGSLMSLYPDKRIVLFEIPEGSLSQEETVALLLNQAATPSRPEASTEALFGFEIP